MKSDIAMARKKMLESIYPGQPFFAVTREFTSGGYAGLRFKDVTTRPPEVGFVCKKPLGGPPYKIVEVRPALDDDFFL